MKKIIRLITIASFIFVGGFVHSTKAATTQTYKLSSYETQVFKLTNAERVKAHLKPLVIDVKLSKVARIKSQDMTSRHYFSHYSPVYGSPFDMMKRFGISYRYAAENIAQGQRTPLEVVKAWMTSPGHRANILNRNLKNIGVGYDAKGKTWTQQFISK